MEKIKINLIDQILGNEKSFCRGKVPTYFSYSPDGEYDLVSHFDILNFSLLSKPKEKTFGIAIESKAIMPLLYIYLRNNISTLKERYQAIFTCHQQLIDFAPDLFKWCSANGFWIGTEYGGGVARVTPKTKNISMLASDKEFCYGHKLRKLIAQTVDKMDGVDVFGDAVGKPIDKVADAISDYRFHIVIENDFTSGYFTEKLLNPLVCGSIPIYLGCSDLEKYFLRNGILSLSMPLHLQDYINKLTPELYDSKREFILKNYELALQYNSPEDYIATHYGNLFT